MVPEPVHQIKGEQRQKRGAQDQRGTRNLVTIDAREAAVFDGVATQTEKDARYDQCKVSDPKL